MPKALLPREFPPPPQKLMRVPSCRPSRARRSTLLTRGGLGRFLFSGFRVHNPFRAQSIELVSCADYRWRLSHFASPIPFLLHVHTSNPSSPALLQVTTPTSSLALSLHSYPHHANPKTCTRQGWVPLESGFSKAITAAQPRSCPALRFGNSDQTMKRTTQPQPTTNKQVQGYLRHS